MLTGGEIAAVTIADAVCRMVPGVLAENASFEDESHFAGVLEYPQYTKPRDFMGHTVPEVLVSGDHKKIAKWREEQSKLITRERRQDLLNREDD